VIGRRRGIAISAMAIALTLAATAWATFTSVNVDHDPPLLSIDDTNPVTHENNLTVGIDGGEILIAESTFPPFTDDEECMDEDGNSLTLHCDPTGISRLEIMLRDGEDTLTLGLGELRAAIAQVVRGGAGEDELVARSGRQVLLGGGDADRLVGGRGRDWLKGNDGSDVLRGGPGDDYLKGGPGLDHCLGGRGDDTVMGCESPIP
jgi:hypothetical protein